MSNKYSEDTFVDIFFDMSLAPDPTPGHFPDIIKTFWGDTPKMAPRHFWDILGGVLAVAVRPMQPKTPKPNNQVIILLYCAFADWALSLAASSDLPRGASSLSAISCALTVSSVLKSLYCSQAQRR